MNKSEKEKQFKILYNQYFNYVYNYVFKRIPLQQDVEDIVEETFIAIWELFEKIDEGKNIKNLIFRIASNKLNDFLRKKYKIKYIEQNIDIDKQNHIENKYIKNNYTKILIEMAESLGEREKKFLELKYFQNFTYKELAKVMNITINNAKVINNRLVKKLKNIWIQKMNNQNLQNI